MTDKTPMLDLGLAVDHQRHVYQVHLYGSDVVDGADTVIAVLPPQRLEQVLRQIKDLAMRGYVPVGEGTAQPDIRLPCPAEKLLEQWR